MVKVKKAVIPAAGYGTRFLPATKAMAKEMLPIVDKPTSQFIVEEAIEAGIEDILIVTGKSKRPIEDHFDSNIELEEQLRKQGKDDLLDLVKPTNVNLFFVRQSYPKGLGHAILQAKAFVGNEPFVVMLGDDIMQGHYFGYFQHLVLKNTRVHARLHPSLCSHPSAQSQATIWRNFLFFSFFFPNIFLIVFFSLLLKGNDHGLT